MPSSKSKTPPTVILELHVADEELLLISKLKNLLSDFVAIVVVVPPFRIIFPADGAKPALPLPLSSQFPAISWVPPWGIKLTPESVKFPPTSNVLASAAISRVPEEIRRFPLITKSLPTVFVLVVPPMVTLWKLLLAWVEIAWLPPLKKTVPPDGLNSLSGDADGTAVPSQFPAISIVPPDIFALRLEADV